MRLQKAGIKCKQGQANGCALPVLYSFRRCPYAMRARLAIASAGIACELREIILRDKAEEFLAISPSGTVPLLVLGDGQIIDESFDIMIWALNESDPEGLLPRDSAEQSRFDMLIACTDGPFKAILDRYKYASRYEDVDPDSEREKVRDFLMELDRRLEGKPWLTGISPRLPDLAILPFVRQFAHVDLDWFNGQDWQNVCRWLEAFKGSQRFGAIMKKYPKWQAGDAVTHFPPLSG